MSKFLNVNISPEAIIEQVERETYKATTPNVFDQKNYLQARLGKNETTKTLTIRLLPFTADSGTPFHKVFMHQVRVNTKLSDSGWKTFVCPKHNHFSDNCPFCDTSRKARELKENATSEIEKKKYNEVEFLNRAREFWIVRCIERGHEEDGPKFWLFPHSKKNDGVFNKIINIFERRSKSCNIFDLNEGKDLEITITKDSNNKNVINVIDSDEKTPLSENYEQGMAWINDPKRWDEVYTVKPYEYMSIVIEGGVPTYDKETRHYVNLADKIESDAAKKESLVKENFTPQKRDFSQVPNSVDEMVVDMSPKEAVEDDLPF